MPENVSIEKEKKREKTATKTRKKWKIKRSHASYYTFRIFSFHSGDCIAKTHRARARVCVSVECAQEMSVNSIKSAF